MGYQTMPGYAAITSTSDGTNVPDGCSTSLESMAYAIDVRQPQPVGQAAASPLPPSGAGRGPGIEVASRPGTGALPGAREPGEPRAEAGCSATRGRRGELGVSLPYIAHSQLSASSIQDVPGPGLSTT